VAFLVRVAGIVQVAKSSESSAHVIPAALVPLAGQHQWTDDGTEGVGNLGRAGLYRAIRLHARGTAVGARALEPVCISICGHAPRSISKSLLNNDVY
jgi:hypothetical protein